MQKVLQLCERHGFVVPVLAGDVVDRFKLGPTGELLRHNVLHEWLLSSVVTPEENLFLCQSRALPPLSTNCRFSEELKEQYSYVRTVTGGQLPFGIVEMKERQASDTTIPPQQDARYFEPTNGTELRLYLFTTPGDSTQRYHHWQRIRKMWWRKFSASPGRFSVMDAHSSEANHSVYIQAAFPWGTLPLETISLCTSLPDDIAAVFEARDGRKKVVPHVVECATVLERALITFLSDAYDEVDLPASQREAMRLHRKLAPYKVALAATPCGEGAELGRLATYLGRLLRRAGVSILSLPDAASKSLESQLVRNDALGVPYTAVLNATTLKTGILGLRSRDTTLKEQVHISELKNHIELIFKNY